MSTLTQLLRYAPEGEFVMPDDRMVTTTPMSPEHERATRKGLRKEVQRRAMAGRDPALTAEDRAVAESRAPGRVAADRDLEEMLGAAFGQPIVAADAIGSAMGDPSLANVTNAAVQTGLATYRPAGAMASGVAGLLGLAEAARRDYGPDVFGAANAQVAADALTPDQRRRLQQLSRMRNPTAGQVEEMRALNAIVTSAGTARATAATKAEDERRAFETRTEEERLASERRTAEQKEASTLAERNRSVLAAEDERKRILARDRRFSDTEIGKIYDKVGPAVVAGLAGGLAGGVSKLATPRGSVIYDYVLPGALGSWAGAKAFNAPLEFNAFSTEPDNQTRLAWQTYAQMLPAGHPEKQRIFDAVQRGDFGPPENTLQQTALKEYKENLMPRSLFGAASGVTGGILGSEMARAPGRMLEGLAEMPGRVRSAATRGAGASPSPGGPGGSGGGNAPGSPPPPLPPPQGGPNAPVQPPPPPPPPQFAPYDPATHGVASRQLLDDLLAQSQATRTTPVGNQNLPEQLARGAEARFMAQGLPQVDPINLRSRAQGTATALSDTDAILRSGNIRRTVTAPEARESVLNAATGKDYTLAVPAAVGAGAAAAAALPREAQASVANEVMKHYLNGRDLSSLKVSDIAGGNDPAAVGAFLDRIRRQVDRLPTRSDQLKAVRDIRDSGMGDVYDDDTSPTGRRDARGRFVGAE